MDSHYEMLEEQYKAGTQVWYKDYYGVVSDVINQNNFKTCVEVGIGYGFHARHILENTNVNLILVDPSKWYPNDWFAVDVINNGGGFENLVLKIKKMLSPFENRYKWFRKNSIDVTNNEVGDDTVDVVFIDGNHEYDYVRKDLDFWWKKLKKGGYLLGDDYNMRFPGVIQAVNEFAKNNGLILEFLSKKNSNYPIFKLIKTVDFVETHYKTATNWFEHINLNDYKNKQINYLEIGVFYGSNLLSVAMTYGFHIDSKLYGIDPWEDYTDKIYKTCLKNIENSGLKNKITTIKGFSNIEIPKFQDCFFDIIYIDGNHDPEYVLEDAVLSFRKLKKSGIMIFDSKGDEITKKGIDAFTHAFYKNILYLGTKESQIFIKKL